MEKCRYYQKIKEKISSSESVSRGWCSLKCFYIECGGEKENCRCKDILEKRMELEKAFVEVEEGKSS